MTNTQGKVPEARCQACIDRNDGFYGSYASAQPHHVEAMERAWLWMENQADGQSKGGHATFDLMMLREERDALRTAIDATPSPQAAQQAPAGATDPWQQHMANQAEVIDCEALQRAMVQHGISFPEGGMEYFRASLGEMVNRFVRFATTAAPGTPASSGWISVKDQLPPCRDDQDYIGINSAGFAGIFNAVADIAGNVYCTMETAEESVAIMSDLSIWKPFTRPLPASPTIGGESNGG